MKKNNHINFGIEFEYSDDFEDKKNDVIDTIEKYYGKKCLTVTADAAETTDNFRKWHLKEDGSTGFELATPISRWTDIEKICDVVNDLIKRKKVSITKSDSTHIHFDVENINIKKLLLFWLYHEPALVKMFPKHRYKSGGYAEAFSNFYNKRGLKNIAQIYHTCEELFMTEHSMTLSGMHYEARKTVEIRLMEGTENAKTIKNWVLFCIYFINKSQTIDEYDYLARTTNSKIEELLTDVFGNRVEIKRFFNSRCK